MRDRPRSLISAFSLVEIMIVVAIVGLLAALAMPAFKRVQMRSQNSKVVSDLRVFASMIDTYSQETGAFPDNAASGQLPPELVPYIKASQWSEGPPIGGQWDIEKDNFGITSAVGVHGFTVPNEQLLRMDLKFDDGNLGTGNFRKLASDRFYFIVQE